MKIIWQFFKFGLWFVFGIVILTSCMSCTLLMMTTVRLAYVAGGGDVQSGDLPYQMKDEYSIDDIADLLYKDSNYTLTGGLHGLVGYKGYDYSAGSGTQLFSPLPGSGVVTYNARDGYIGPYDTKGEQNTMLTIKGDAGEIIMFHGNYSLVQPGDIVIGGVTPIGYEASIGNSTGAHSHIVWKPNPNWVAPIKTINQPTSIQHTSRHGNYGSVLSNYNNVQLRISHYVPALGGTNCDSDCTTMASGDKVAEWTLGKNGVYAAACPREWPFGTKFTLDGQTYSCADNGGYINCYSKGDFDPTLGGHTATNDYCWVDILGDVSYPYGHKTSDWSFVK